jgi:hypothetical protein
MSKRPNDLTTGAPWSSTRTLLLLCRPSRTYADSPGHWLFPKINMRALDAAVSFSTERCPKRFGIHGEREASLLRRKCRTEGNVSQCANRRVYLNVIIFYPVLGGWPRLEIVKSHVRKSSAPSCKRVPQNAIHAPFNFSKYDVRIITDCPRIRSPFDCFLLLSILPIHRLVITSSYKSCSFHLGIRAGAVSTSKQFFRLRCARTPSCLEYIHHPDIGLGAFATFR